jgi:hypothetical protein
MEQRVSCKICGASILPQTAERTGGACKPCYIQSVRRAISESPYGEAFDVCFQEPYFYMPDYRLPNPYRDKDSADYQRLLLTPTVRSNREADWHWRDIWKFMKKELETCLRSIRYFGHCDDVFKRQDPDGPRLSDAEDFKQWSMSVIERAQSIADTLEAVGVEAQKDRETILRKINEMQKTVELAYEIIKRREIERAGIDS